MNIASLTRWIEPDLAACRAEAASLRDEFPRLGNPALARKAMLKSRNRAMLAGAATGLASSPLTMIPAALADAAAVLRIEAHMAGVIGAIFDPASADSHSEFLADVLAIIFPAAATQALRQVTIHAGAATTKALIRKYMTEDMIKSTLRFALEFLGIEVTQKAVIAKSIPLIGAGIGAAWNWVEIRAVGARAIKYQQGDESAFGKKRIKPLIQNHLLPPE